MDSFPCSAAAADPATAGGRGTVGGRNSTRGPRCSRRRTADQDRRCDLFRARLRPNDLFSHHRRSPGHDGAEQQCDVRRHRADRAAVRHYPSPRYGDATRNRSSYDEQRFWFHHPRWSGRHSDPRVHRAEHGGRDAFAERADAGHPSRSLVGAGPRACGGAGLSSRHTRWNRAVPRTSTRERDFR
jgi:hypothetical protein